MNASQPPVQEARSQQTNPQQTRQTLFRPEQMRNLPEPFSPEEKTKWENGLTMLYKQMEKFPADNPSHIEAKKKAQEFSNSLRIKMQQARAQATQGQTRQSNQPPASSAQGNGVAPNQNQAQQPRPMGGPSKPSEQMLQHINSFQYMIPPPLVVGTPEATKWLHENKTRYGKALFTMESTATQLKALDKEREQGLAEKDYIMRKDKWRSMHKDASRWVEAFRKTQEDLTSQLKAQNGATGSVRPNMNLAQQAPTAAQQNTETVNAAIQAVRNQQTGARSNVPANGQMVQQNDQISQAPSVQPLAAPSQQSNVQASSTQGPNVKVEGGTNQPQVNTALATAPHLQQQSLSRQQNSPHSAVPPSATSTGPPHPLSHDAALKQAARTYSSTQTSGTPNVMGGASHAHPSVAREAPNTNTNKMPIPKQLPPGATVVPQPVPMQPSRPTISGGPTNAGGGLLGQPVLQKTPAFNLEGEGERVMNKRKLDELVRQVTGGGEGLDSGEGLTPEVEDCILSVADEFVDQVITAACKCAKARGSKTLEIRDIQLILERNYNIRIPGYASDEIRTVRKFQPAQGWITKMGAIQVAKVNGGKADL